MKLRRSSRVPKLSCRLRGTDAEDRMTQGGGDGLGDEDGVGDEREAEESRGSSFKLMLKKNQSRRTRMLKKNQSRMNKRSLTSRSSQI